MDRQTAIDRITETENLTDGLEDDDANWLLDWGIAHVDGLVTGIEDEDAAGKKLNQLMSVMRTLNQIAADRAARPPDALAGDIRTFLERYQQAFGAPKAATPTAPKDGQGSGASPSTTPPAAKAGGDQPHQTPTSSKPPKSAPSSASAKKDEAASMTPPTSPSPSSPSPSPATAPSSGAPPANAAANATTQSGQASDQAAQAASKIVGMNPKEAMQYLLSLAETGAAAA
jgi:hypothetical protein